MQFLPEVNKTTFVIQINSVNVTEEVFEQNKMILFL